MLAKIVFCCIVCAVETSTNALLEPTIGGFEVNDHYRLAANGTLTHWRGIAAADDILFPEQEIEIGGVKKLRGGAPVCCPIFGTMPNTKHYEGVDLPKHGLVRLSDPASLFDNVVGFNFTHPWNYDVWVTVAMSDAGRRLEHEIIVRKEFSSGGSMPLSMGFHPYFATRGDMFHISYGERRITCDEIKTDKPFFINRAGNEHLWLELLYGRTLEISIADGDYTGFCIWTDDKSRYICVEPVLIGTEKRYIMLDEGVAVRGKCKIRIF